MLKNTSFWDFRESQGELTCECRWIKSVLVLILLFRVLAFAAGMNSHVVLFSSFRQVIFAP